MPVLEAIAPTTVVRRITSILATIAHILAAIPHIFLSVTPVLSTVPHILEPVAPRPLLRLDRRRARAQQREGSDDGAHERTPRDGWVQ